MRNKKDKNKNNSVHYNCRYSDSISDKNNFKCIDCDSPNLRKNEKNSKKKDITLKKRKYGELIIENNNLNKKIKVKSRIKNLDNLKDKSTKNKNNIITYNNIFKKEKKDVKNYYNRIEKHKINTSASIYKTIDKIHKNYFISKKKRIMESNKSYNNISALTKRKSYIVPSIKARKRKQESKEKSLKNDNTILNEENKILFISHLIESKQIEYLKNYEKYKSDSKDKLIKKNKKKIN